jgi:hypothetical protein
LEEKKKTSLNRLNAPYSTFALCGNLTMPASSVIWILGSPEDIKTRIDLHKERVLQETMDKDPSCRSFAWKILRQAKLVVGATTYIEDTEDQATILPSLQSTSNWIVLALAGKSKPGTIPLPVEGFVTVMTTTGKAFRKRQWWHPKITRVFICRLTLNDIWFFLYDI